MIEAPEIPTTEELALQHVLMQDSILAISEQKARVAKHITSGFFAALSGCSAREADEAILRSEGTQIQLLQSENDDLSTGQRACLWKPRSNEKDWHGEETTNPSGAYGLMTR